MSSQRKIDSARINGEKSHGPVTEEGRKTSSMNALKYGLTAHTVVLPNEDHEEYDLLLDTYFNDLRPTDIFERDLVVEMVNTKWRQRRFSSVESLMLEREIFKNQAQIDKEYGSDAKVVAHAFALRNLSLGGSLPMLSQVESRLERIYARASRTLHQHRQLREKYVGKRTQSQDRTLAPALSFEETSNEEN
ncbi:MAG TPA: hypothetical protein VIX89_17825 [Bryobacteraceae bacterium]